MNLFTSNQNTPKPCCFSTFFWARPERRGGILAWSDPSNSVKSPPGRIPSENMTCFGSLFRLLPAETNALTAQIISTETVAVLVSSPTSIVPRSYVGCCWVARVPSKTLFVGGFLFIHRYHASKITVLQTTQHKPTEKQVSKFKEIYKYKTSLLWP